MITKSQEKLVFRLISPVASIEAQADLTTSLQEEAVVIEAEIVEALTEVASIIDEDLDMVANLTFLIFDGILKNFILG